ncbi:DUF4070 domain-containing protein [bacterium]|nr:DUF4070 domain-containing protein [bacterium]
MQPYKNILLVYPEVPQNTYWSFHYSLKFINKKSAMPPLGLITIASLFTDSYDLKLIDMNITPLTDDHLEWADAVFLSAMIVQKQSFAETVERCNLFQVPVIAGGPYPTSSYQEINGIDHFVLGEVENTLLDFLDRFQKGTAPHITLPPPFPNLAITPVPRFDLLDLSAYSSMSIQYSRGCPFKCEFCDIWSVYGNKPRLKPAASIVNELDALFRNGWKGAVFVVDDNFIGNKNRVKKDLLPQLFTWQKKHHYPFRFFTEASINLAEDSDLLSAMKLAGFNEVFIGIETPSEEALLETGKTQNTRLNLYQSVSTIQSHGIGVMAGFIIGFDSDSPDIADRQIEFIQKAGIPQAMIGLLEALPGTKLFKRLSKEGRLLTASQGNNTHKMATNFVTKMGKQTLANVYEKILSTIYDVNLKNYFQRCNRLLDAVGNAPFFQRKITLADFRSFLKSLFFQPFTSYGFQYLRFLGRNVIKNRQTFGEAVRFAIIGHHFHVITRESLKTEKIALELEKSYQYLRNQLNKQSTLIMDNSKEAIQNILDLWNQKKEQFGKIRKRVDRLHVDFRSDIQKQYVEIDQKIRDLFKALEPVIKREGIVLN